MSGAPHDAARRLQFLQALGIGPIWRQRLAGAPVIADGALASGESAGVRVVAQSRLTAASTMPRARVPNAGTAGWDEHVTRAPFEAPAEALPHPGSSDAEIAAMDWQALQSAVAQCTRCSLSRSRQQTVFGSGDSKAGWLFIGEGPGRTEDQQGLPFVGPAGKLLDNLLASIGLKRTENTFIANVVKCRPSDADGNDRAPTVEESAACRPYLERQIALLKPSTIVALGKVAAVTLLAADPKTPLARLRGTVHDFAGTALVVTYHPAYLLREPLDKAASWRDLCLASDAYRNTGTLAL